MTSLAALLGLELLHRAVQEICALTKTCVAGKVSPEAHHAGDARRPMCCARLHLLPQHRLDCSEPGGHLLLLPRVGAAAQGRAQECASH